jgi:hypothetical protein
MVTIVPTVPLGGEKLLMVGVTLKLLELVADPPAVVTAIFPVFAPLGTAVTITGVSLTQATKVRGNPGTDHCLESDVE